MLQFRIREGGLIKVGGVSSIRGCPAERGRVGPSLAAGASSLF